MEKLVFHIDQDRRKLAGPGQLDDAVLTLNWSDENKYNWIQARQYEASMRQALVKVLKGDGSKENPFIPMDLTNTNAIFEGVQADGTHRVYDTEDCTMTDPANGEFMYKFPAQIFAVAGSYKQAFFRIVRAGTGESVATLEFNMEVLADKVISGLVPADYITPFNDLYSKLEDILKNAGVDLDKFKADWDAKLQELVSKYGKDLDSLQEIITRLQDRITDIAAQVKANNVVTLPMLSKYAGCPVMIGVAHLELGTDPDGFPDMYPSVHAYIGKYGAGLGGAGTTPAGGSAVYDVNVRAVRNESTEIEIYVSPENITGFMEDFDMTDPDASFGGAFAYIYSGIYTLEVEFKGATVKGFDVDSTFKTKFADEKAPAPTTATTPTTETGK